MDETTRVIQEYYDRAVLKEWDRIAGRPEFLLTCRMLDLCEKVWEREDLYSFSEHLMYVGCKTAGME